jgi:hypothetical protein
LDKLGVSVRWAPSAAHPGLTGIPLRSAAYTLDGRQIADHGRYSGSIGDRKAAEYYIFRDR